MKLLAPGDFVIWRKKRICRIVREAPPSAFSMTPTRRSDVKPAGLTDSDWVGILNDTSTWLVQDDNSGDEFKSSGADLLYVNEMQVLAIMANRRDTSTSSARPIEQKEE